MLALVHAAVSRESGDAGVVERAPHRHRVPLGLLMLAQGWITQDQLQRGLHAQRQGAGGRIGDWLMQECSIEPELVTRGLSMQWGCPVLGVDGFMPEAMALVMPQLFVKHLGMLPLRVAGSKILYMGSSTELDASLTLALERMTGLQVESGVMEESLFEDARSRLADCAAVETKQETVSDSDTLSARITALLEQAQPCASHIVRIHGYYWLRMWLEPGTNGKNGRLPVSSEDMIDHVFSVGF